MRALKVKVEFYTSCRFNTQTLNPNQPGLFDIKWNGSAKGLPIIILNQLNPGYKTLHECGAT